MGEGAIAVIILFVVIFGVIAYGVYLFITRYYVRIPPNKAAIIFGRRHEITDPLTGDVRVRGFRIVKGGAALVIPLLEEVEYLDLSNRKIELEVRDIRSLNGVKVDVQAVAIIRIGTEESALETAATQFGNMNDEKTNKFIEELLNKTLEGHFRTIISTMTPEGLYRDRSQFSQEVQRSAGNPLEGMGMLIVDFTIKRVSDEVNYLNSLGVAPAEEEKKNANIAKSIAEREVVEQQAKDKIKVREAVERQTIQEEQSKGKEAIELIQVHERSKIAKIESEIAKVKSEIEWMHKKIIFQEKEDELELIKVKFEQKRKVFEAAGSEQAARRKAREVENLARAESEAIRLKAQAEADGKRLLAEAYKELDPTAKMLLIVEQLPMVLRALLGEEGLAKVFGEIAKPIGNIDSIKIYDFGNGGGGSGGGGGNGPIDRFANTAPQMLMGMVSKLNDMGMGDLLQKIGLTSDVVQDMSKSQMEDVDETVKPEAKTEDRVNIKGVKVESVKVITKEEQKKVEQEIVPHEEIKTGDTVELKLDAKKKKKKK
ncbi:MAG: flotillin [Saprospiraceae bacterium]|jgi:flotillin